MRITALIPPLACAILLTACGERTDVPLPDGVNGISSFSFANPDNADDTYSAIEYADRLYIPYGTPGSSIDDDEYVRCIGYLIQDGQEMKDVTFWQLRSVHNNDYLVWRDNGIMSQPVFYRAADTKGASIQTPSYINSLDYDYWK